MTGSPARSPPSCPLCWVIQPLLLIFIVPASPSTPGPKREAVHTVLNDLLHCSTRDIGNITQQGLSANAAAGDDKGNLVPGTTV